MPVPVKGLTRLTAVIAGENFNFAIRDDGTVFDWGDNSAGELGIGSTVSQVSTPVPVKAKNLTGVTSLSCGGAFGMAIVG